MKNSNEILAKFCHLIDVNFGTLTNWEQGRREPTGSSEALLRCIYTQETSKC